jgi:hypothetical protein
MKLNALLVQNLLKCEYEISEIPCIATVSADDPSTEPLRNVTPRDGHYAIRDSQNIHSMVPKSSKEPPLDMLSPNNDAERPTETSLFFLFL